MRPSTKRTTSYLSAVVAVLMIAGCSPDIPGPGTDSQSPTESAQPTKSGLTAKEQALADGVEAIRIYSQTYVDLFIDPSMPIDTLHEVAVDPALDQDLRSAATYRYEGWRNEPGSTVSVLDGQLRSLETADKARRMAIWACIDTTAVRSVHPDGSRTRGGRQLLEFTLVETQLSTPGGWAVSDSRPANKTSKAAKC